MRVGISWPGTHGRRMYLSGGILFWIVFGYLTLFVWLAVWAVALAVRLVMLMLLGLGWLVSLPWHAKGRAY